MTMKAFHMLFPEVARDESRSAAVFESDDLPNRTYLFQEAYCAIPKCDCRRVILSVIDTENGRLVATISHGFEPPKPPFDEFGQTFLDPLNPQSEYSDELLELFRGMIEHDPAYHDRLVRHYKMWKRVVDDPRHPDHERIRASRPGVGSSPPSTPIRRSGPKVGPNDPCPCGSGRKFKKCCRDRG